MKKIKTMKELFVISERDHKFKIDSVIGVADHLDEVDKMINEHFGADNITTISKEMVEESGIEYILTIDVQAQDEADKNRFTLTILHFNLNRI